MKSDEKRCPKCAETIKKAALVCKHCGATFDAKAVAAQSAADTKNGAFGCLAIIVLIAVVATCSMSSDGSDGSKPTDKKDAAPSEIETLSAMQGAAKEAMKASLKDPASAKYQNVFAHPVTKNPGAFAFCGEVNAKNGFGGYTGFERFIAGPGIAVTESSMPDFGTAWSQLCTTPGHKVWF